FEPHVAHQALHRTARHAMPFTTQLLPDLPRPVDLLVVVPDTLDGRPQLGVAPRPRRLRRGIRLLRLAQELHRWRDRQHRADRLGSVEISVLVDEGQHHFGRRSSSAWAKNAAAFFKISLARRNSKFSRSSAFSRVRSSVVSPARSPRSRSVCRTHRRSDSVRIPSFSATDRIAAHCDGYSGVWSKTIRTARSRTSGACLLGRPIGSILSRNGPSDQPGTIQIEGGALPSHD